MKTPFTIVGGLEGATGNFGGYQFVDGVHEFVGSPQDVDTVTPILESYYSAYRPDRLEHGRAVYAAALAEAEASASVAALSTSDAVSGSESQDRQDSQEASGDAQQDEGAEGAQGAPQEPGAKTLAEALAELDWANDAHWTARGLPATDELARIVGRAVARAEVDEIAPDFNRSTAKTASN